MLSFPNMHQGRLATCVRRMDVGTMGQEQRHQRTWHIAAILRRHAIEILSPGIDTDPYENLEATEPFIQTSESCTVHDTTRNGVL